MLPQQGNRVVIEPDLAIAGQRLGPSLDDVRTDQKQWPGHCETSGLQVGAVPPKSARLASPGASEQDDAEQQPKRIARAASEELSRLSCASALCLRAFFRL